MNVAEASKKLKISVDAVYKLCRAGKIGAYKVNGYWVISETSVDVRIREKNHNGLRHSNR